MLVPRDNSKSPLDQNVHWDSGFLIDYNYSFLYAGAAKKLMENSLRKAKGHKNGPAVSADTTSEEEAQAIGNANVLLLHHTVGTYIHNEDTLIY